ncbi:MAG: DUF2628 domain-containing protein [Alphaproteobacteria bacterium]|nr:DUF2628 domain-containing protein [Alphaproteobacteria bacterium]
MAKMRIYTVHIKPDAKNPYEAPIFIEEAFNWWAFIFRGFWALYNRLWLWAAILIALEIALQVLVIRGVIPAFTALFVRLGIQLLIGFHANDLRRAKLRKQGYITSDIVTGDNLVGAEQRFFERYYPSHRFKTSTPAVVMPTTSHIHMPG